jgi:hypothetical protein
MSAGLVSFLITIGAATWIYTQLQRRSGNNTQQSIVATVIAGAFIFIVAFVVLNMIF